jgi:hypothetical protein
MNSKYVWQWYWGYDWLNNKVKNIYFGPRLSWMKLFKKEKKNEKKVDRRRNKISKRIKKKI